LLAARESASGVALLIRLLRTAGARLASAEDIRMSRVVGIAAVLFMAGLLPAFGTALRQPARA
jgi:hypothetical protein